MKREITPGVKVIEYPNYHRYQIDGKWAIGVTTALKGIPKEALQGWNARTVAEWAANNPERLLNMVRADGIGPAVQFMKALPNQKRDTAAVRGRTLHTYAQQLIAGDEVEVPDELVPSVEGFVQYLDEHEPVTVHDELVVGNREHMVAGRLDNISDLPAHGRCLIDVKTGGNVYGEYALQCAGYRFMEFYMDADGNEQPMPQVDRCFILHIQHGTYELIPAQADDDAYGKFLQALGNYRSNVQGDKLRKLLGEPVPPPRREAVA